MQRYIVSYDISDDRRRMSVYKTLLGFGERMQYSVFRCDMNAVRKSELKLLLAQLIHHEEDQILLVDLGPCEGRGATCIEALGLPYRPPSRAAVIV